LIINILDYFSLWTYVQGIIYINIFI